MIRQKIEIFVNCISTLNPNSNEEEVRRKILEYSTSCFSCGNEKSRMKNIIPMLSLKLSQNQD